VCRLVTPPVPVSRVGRQICWRVGGMDMSMAIWVGVLRVCGHGSAGGALRSPAELLWPTVRLQSQYAIAMAKAGMRSAGDRHRAT
jgi:hypothetical protein